MVVVTGAIVEAAATHLLASHSDPCLDQEYAYLNLLDMLLKVEPFAHQDLYYLLNLALLSLHQPPLLDSSQLPLEPEFAALLAYRLRPALVAQIQELEVLVEVEVDFVNYRQL